jgi:hypothetical protein
MPAYAVAHLREVAMGTGDSRVPAVHRCNAGALRESIHRPWWQDGGVGGAWPGHLIIIEFPDRERARVWYESSAYQEVLPLRTNNSEGNVVAADGVSEGHRATDVLGE